MNNTSPILGRDYPMDFYPSRLRTSLQEYQLQAIERLFPKPGAGEKLVIMEYGESFLIARVAPLDRDAKTVFQMAMQEMALEDIRRLLTRELPEAFCILSRGVQTPAQIDRLEKSIPEVFWLYKFLSAANREEAQPFLAELVNLFRGVLEDFWETEVEGWHYDILKPQAWVKNDE